MKMSTFTVDDNNIFRGQIQALGFGSLQVISEEVKSNEGKPYFKIIADPKGSPYEVGRFWPKETLDGLKYYSVSFDSPFFAAPINAALFPNDEPGTYNLVWKRLQPTSKLEAKNEVQVAAETEQASFSLGTEAPSKLPTVDKGPKQPFVRRKTNEMNATP